MTDERTFTASDVVARESEVMSVTSREILAILGATVGGYKKAVAQLTDDVAIATHSAVIAAVEEWAARARIHYGSDGHGGRSMGYVTSCDEPGCFETILPPQPTLEQAGEYAVAHGWSVVTDTGGVTSDARCPQHLPQGP